MRQDLQGKVQILGADAPLIPSLAHIVARRKNLNTTQDRHARCDLAQGHGHAAPMRVDGDGAIERPSRGDGAAGLCASLVYLRGEGCTAALFFLISRVHRFLSYRV